MNRLMTAVVALVFVGLVGPIIAADNPTGTWKWTASFGGQDREQTLTLKLEGDKLTGSMPGRDNEVTQISDASFKDNKLSFSVTREFNGQKRTTKYEGTLSGDTIKGKTTRERDGNVTSTDWEAKRQK
jgi:hypothetical protein